MNDLNHNGKSSQSNVQMRGTDAGYKQTCSFVSNLKTMGVLDITKLA